MKKLFFYLGSLALIAACSKKAYEPPKTSSSKLNRIKVVTGEAIQGGLTKMNETFKVGDKNLDLNYAYKGFCRRPNVNGKLLKATSTFSIDDLRFITWHSAGNKYGGAISVYKKVGEAYKYLELLKFVDTDWYDIEVAKNGSSSYTIYASGQRDIDFSDYTIPKDHMGAVVGSIIFKPNQQFKFERASYKEKALPNVAANGLEMVDGSLFVVTGASHETLGEVNCGIYKIPASFTSVSDKYESMYSFKAIASSPVAGRKKLAALTDNGLGPWLVGFDDIQDNSLAKYSGGGTKFELSLNRRAELVWENENRVIAGLGHKALMAVDFSTKKYFVSVADLGHTISGVDVDRSNRIIYCATEEGGLQVLAASGFAPRSPINSYDILGKFKKPTIGDSTFDEFYASNISVHNENEMALTTSNGSVYFVNRI